ncbi:invasion associated locus B family protein [Acuticoccus sp. I52.16.1]|uniref:invasion associated locus B family protein n=1 Tax=Acuticoccus sp. I52.16.1 TaxID=2928472 RepID=UPI001FCF8D3A|nr:invasion associated locus B family protein [Acuticoccus sp. I52.16.1]UOM37012.1 invasion associated locus B family protein [Acuticoccus sp. I52.16.1]
MRFAILAAVSALATAALLPAGAAQAQSSEDPNWMKVCTQDPRVKKDICLVTQELRTGGGQVLASAAVRGFRGEQRRSLLIAVPTGMVIEPGVQIQVDGGDAQKAEYQVCLETACWAERAVSDAFIDSMKNGSTMRLTAYNREGKQVPFDMSLAGFTTAYDGEALSPDKIADITKQRQEKLEQSQEDFAARLRAAQREALSGTGTGN